MMLQVFLRPPVHMHLYMHAHTYSQRGSPEQICPSFLQSWIVPRI